MPDQTGNVGSYEVRLRSVEDEIASDDRVQVRFFAAVSPNTNLVDVRDLTFPPAHRFTVPAYPQASNLVAEVNAPRFRTRRSGIFTLASGENKTEELILFRQPSKWKADFTLWNELGNKFQRLTRVLENSPNLRIIGGSSFNLFVGDAYNSVSSAKESLSKSSLLNLYAKLSMTIEPTLREQPWFSFVRRILEIDRERMLAIVEPEMGRIVRAIKDKIKDFKEYKDTPAGNHFGNIPIGYSVKKSKMFSIKTQEKLGNLQLTISPAIAPDGNEVLLLDADIDENGELFKHLADLFKHKFSGGTHPFDIHEYLALAYPGEPFGYSLVVS